MNMKRVAALIAALVLVMAAATASALTVTGYDSDSSTRTWETSLFFARMEEMTGVAVTAHAVTEQKDYDKLIAGMTSGSIPADVLFKAELSRSRERELLNAGAIIDLAPMIEENMPNLTALLDAHPEWRENITLPDGRIASLPLLNDQERQVMVWINRVWLDNLGVAVPQSVEELTAALMAFKDKDPNQNYAPDEVAADMMGVWEMRWLLPYFGVVADDYNIARVDGKAVFAPELPQYRAFIELLRDWNAKGIFAKDAFLGVHSASLYEEQDENAVATSGIMVTVSPYTHVPIEYMTEYEALLMPGPDGQTVWRDMLGGVWTGAFAVTSACEDPAAALKWVDALYSEEGAKLAYAGIEGEDYKYNSEGNWEFNVDTFRTVDDIRAEVLMYTGATMPGVVPNAFLANVDSAPDRHVIEQNARVGTVTQQVTLPYALSDAAQAKADALNMELAALVDKGIARFATGEVELNDETYAAWLAELEAAGSAEAAAKGYFGERQGGEAQEVVDEAQAVGHEEVVAGLAAETAYEAAKVAVGTAEVKGDGFQAVLSRRQRLQKIVCSVDASRMEIALEWLVDCRAVGIVVAHGFKGRDIQLFEALESIFFSHFLGN